MTHEHTWKPLLTLTDSGRGRGWECFTSYDPQYPWQCDCGDSILFTIPRAIELGLAYEADFRIPERWSGQALDKPLSAW